MYFCLSSVFAPGFLFPFQKEPNVILDDRPWPLTFSLLFYLSNFTAKELGGQQTSHRASLLKDKHSYAQYVNTLKIQREQGQCDSNRLLFESDKTRAAPCVKVDKLNLTLFQSPSNFFLTEPV